MTNNQAKQILAMIKQAKVEWKPLGDVFEIIAGGDVPKDALSIEKTDEFCIPILSNGIGKKALYGWTNQAKINKPSLTISARGTIGWTSYRENPFFPIVRLLVLTPKVSINLKFAYYFMKMIENDYKIPESGIPQLTKPMIKDILIPIPPLELQKEIVKILDKITELKTTLETELCLRTKQYHYYRDFLLSENELAKVGFEWKSLGELAEIGTGSRNTNEAVIDGIYPFFVRSQEPRKINEYEFDEVAIITAGDGVGVGKVFHFVTGKYALHQRAYRIVVKSNALLPKFLFYFIKTSFAHYLEKASVNSSVTSLRKPMFEKFQIPIPPLDTQAKIVAILDKFDCLTNSITDGLPKEIELRRKQYEYYRELLLGFDKP